MKCHQLAKNAALLLLICMPRTCHANYFLNITNCTVTLTHTDVTGSEVSEVRSSGLVRVEPGWKYRISGEKPEVKLGWEKNSNEGNRGPKKSELGPKTETNHTYIVPETVTNASDEVPAYRWPDGELWCSGQVSFYGFFIYKNPVYNPAWLPTNGADPAWHGVKYDDYDPTSAWTSYDDPVVVGRIQYGMRPIEMLGNPHVLYSSAYADEFRAVASISGFADSGEVREAVNSIGEMTHFASMGGLSVPGEVCSGQYLGFAEPADDRYRNFGWAGEFYWQLHSTGEPMALGGDLTVDPCYAPFGTWGGVYRDDLKSGNVWGQSSFARPLYRFAPSEYFAKAIGFQCAEQFMAR